LTCFRLADVVLKNGWSLFAVKEVWKFVALWYHNNRPVACLGDFILLMFWVNMLLRFWKLLSSHERWSQCGRWSV